MFIYVSASSSIEQNISGLQFFLVLPLSTTLSGPVAEHTFAKHIHFLVQMHQDWKSCQLESAQKQLLLIRLLLIGLFSFYFFHQALIFINYINNKVTLFDMIVVIELLNLLHEGGDKNETNDVHILPDSFVDWEQNILRLHALTEQVFL